MKNWKTTVGGLITSAATMLISSSNIALHTIGQICAIVGPLLLGASAVDSKSKPDSAI